MQSLLVQAGPNQLRFPDHDWKLQRGSIISHCSELSIENDIQLLFDNNLDVSRRQQHCHEEVDRKQLQMTTIKTGLVILPEALCNAQMASVKRATDEAEFAGSEDPNLAFFSYSCRGWHLSSLVTFCS